MITVGGCLAYCNRRVSPPRISMSSSLTILMTCWAGFSALLTSSPAARCFTAPMNWRTTGSATSASSSAIRISRATASMSAGDSRPLPRRPVKTECSRSDRVSNTREPLADAKMSPSGYGMSRRRPASLASPSVNFRNALRPIDAK